MLAEEEDVIPTDSVPDNTHDKGVPVNLILGAIEQTIPVFLDFLKTQGNFQFNENELAQQLVSRLRRKICQLQYPFTVGEQYEDIENGSPGKSDFYFYPIEEEKSTSSIFSVEAKRLPAPSNDRQKEYVYDARVNKNGIKLNGGGIERYKNGAHGRNLNQCAILGFIESNDFDWWLKEINQWIEELFSEENSWTDDETLTELIEHSQHYASLKSTVKRILEEKLLLHHLWVKIK